MLPFVYISCDQNVCIFQKDRVVSYIADFYFFFFFVRAIFRTVFIFYHTYLSMFVVIFESNKSFF